MPARAGGPVGRYETLDAALELVEGRVREIWSLGEEDVRLARRFFLPLRRTGHTFERSSCRRSPRRVRPSPGSMA